MSKSQTGEEQKITIAPMLSVRNGARAIEFYKVAFEAQELYRVDGEGGAVVAQLSVGESEFWLADESPEHLNFSPESLGGGSVRMVMIANDPDAAFQRAVAAQLSGLWVTSRMVGAWDGSSMRIGGISGFPGWRQTPNFLHCFRFERCRSYVNFLRSLPPAPGWRQEPFYILHH